MGHIYPREGQITLFTSNGGCDTRGRAVIFNDITEELCFFFKKLLLGTVTGLVLELFSSLYLFCRWGDFHE